MEDSEIVAQFWNREESAIVLCEKTYGSYCRSIALRILEDVSDAENVSTTPIRQPGTAFLPTNRQFYLHTLENSHEESA